MRVKNIKSGFTLIESLVYVAIFGVVFTVIVQFSLNTQENNQIASLRKELGDLEVLVDASINESFKTTVSIDSTNSIFDSDNGSLILNLNDSTTVRYYLENNKIKVNRGGIVNNLTTSDFTCSKFFIEQILNPSLSGTRITITCTSVKRNQVKDTFTTNYIL